jgi:hypothetical protein
MYQFVGLLYHLEEVHQMGPHQYWGYLRDADLPDIPNQNCWDKVEVSEVQPGYKL